MSNTQKQFLFDTVSFVTEESSKIDLGLVVAFLNSKILDWYFRLGSTNSKVNEYQYNALPIPRLTDSVRKVIGVLFLKSRIGKSRGSFFAMHAINQGPCQLRLQMLLQR